MTGKTKRRISAGSGVLAYVASFAALAIHTPHDHPVVYALVLILIPSIAAGFVGAFVADCVCSVAEILFGDDQ